MKFANFRVKFDARAVRDFRKLSQKVPTIVSSLIKVIDSLLSNPHRGKALKGNKKGCYSCRIGDYRIIYEI